jgi:predicted dehydrogenase
MSKRKLKVGIVGCGVVATAYYLPYLMDHPEVELNAVCDLEPERTQACQRLFHAKEGFNDYFEMLQKADIEAVFILTSPATHVRFTLAAVQAKKHVLLQKPMALTLEDANTIARAVKASGVKAVIEPSDHTPLHPHYATARKMIAQGVLGDPYWFLHAGTAPDFYHPMLGGNPYGLAAFYSKDSGGALFDFPYGPNQIVSVLGSCKSVMGMAVLSKPERQIVPEDGYTAFLQRANDPYNVNYWDEVVNAPRTQSIQAEAEDNIYCVYEMLNGWTGAFHVGRPFHPMPKGINEGGFKVFGTDGNMIFDINGKMISVISSRKDLLPKTDANGWYHLDYLGDLSKAAWPKPIPGGFNYYEVSSQHLIDCVLRNREPLLGVDWGVHITEMMWGILESSRTGQRYTMTSLLPDFNVEAFNADDTP